jgi:hypothetical protein
VGEGPVSDTRQMVADTLHLYSTRCSRRCNPPTNNYGLNSRFWCDSNEEEVCLCVSQIFANFIME